MARRVFLHIGVPKSGTTFVQTVMWHNRGHLRRQGFLYPGDRRFDHYRAQADLRGTPGGVGPDGGGAWSRLVAELAAWDGDGLLSHEFYCLATPEQAGEAVAALAPAQVEVVVTARDYVRQFPALWQEALKMSFDGTFDEFIQQALRHELQGPWGWATQDLPAILEQWSSAVPRERIHIITLPPPGAPRDLLWQRWCEVLGLDDSSLDVEVGSSNASLGTAQSALLHDLKPYLSPHLRENSVAHPWVRGYFTERVLVPQAGPRFAPRPADAARLRELSIEAADALREAGYPVTGDLEELVPAREQPTLPHPDDVTESERLDVALRAINQMIEDVRRISKKRDEFRAKAATAAARDPERPPARQPTPSGPPVPENAQRLRVDDERLWLPSDLEPDRTYDVIVNGLHVWSVQPRRDGRAGPRGQTVTWPKAMRSYLIGSADVGLRDHTTDTILASGSHVFAGDSSRVVSVTDAAGRPLIMDKWDKLSHPLWAVEESVVNELMDHVERLLADLRDKAGVPAYICCGTLLGAVRNGELIGHDNDIDVAYVSELPYPADVVQEGYRVERVLRAAGWVVRRGSTVRLNVKLTMSDGSRRCIDVFTSHWVEDIFYLPVDVGFPLPRETVLPLSTVTLMGRELPAPADAERMLAAQYGEGWRVPDPSFKYPDRPWLMRRFMGWFGGVSTRRKHWEKFNLVADQVVPEEPSDFARWVAQEYPSDRPLVDVGSGTGRDGIWFAGPHGRDVLGIDFSANAIRRSNRLAHRRKASARFEEVNLNDLRAALALGAQLSRSPEPVDIYARFIFHDLDPFAQDNLLRMASMALRRGGHLFAEFRTTQDRGRVKVFNDHPRRYVDPDQLASAIQAQGGRVVARVEGRGLARFGRKENPHMCRLVATWA